MCSSEIQVNLSVKKALLKKVSIERISNELGLIFAHDNIELAIQLLLDSKLLKSILHFDMERERINSNIIKLNKYQKCNN